MDSPSIIFVVDDDPDLRTLICDYLTGHGYRVTATESALEMRRAMAAERPDLIILDVMMPGEDGLSAARHLASEPNAPAIIMLSALGSDTDRIIGLDVGADNCLAKPCNPRELLARVRARLRRRQSEDTARADTGGRYEFEGWRLDVMRQDLRDPTGTVINLSSGEFALLRSFVEHPQRILTRDQLIEIARGRNAEVFDPAIDTQISRLRRKLHDRAGAELIRTVRNQGYMLLPKVVRR